MVKIRLLLTAWILLWHQSELYAAEELTHAPHRLDSPPQQNNRSTDTGKYRVTLFNPKQGEDKERLWSQTKLIFGLGFGAMGVIALMPEDVSNWDISNDEPLKKWWSNVRSSPIWDEDTWSINYVGHTYFGGVYYQVARKSGYSQWDSFAYSALMSTFYWEYGIEAVAEVPSIQDLVVTPIGGWIYGEWAYHQEKEIIANHGKAMGSEFWGSTALFFLDPVDSIGVGINHLLGKELIRTGTAIISPHPSHFDAATGQTYDNYWGVDVVFTF